MENGKWKIRPADSKNCRPHSRQSFVLCCPKGPRFRRSVAENAYTVIHGETRILSSFSGVACFGSHGQRFLLAVGFSGPMSTTTANSAVIVAT
ncbi:MAG: hypothetical protein L0387_16725, partial [Acidobacteria bacterium]|nr:hypothetical protein [Acidobacteriota bacterium]